MKTRIIISVVCLLAANVAGAEVYKCVEAGKVVYSDAPCPEGTGKAISVRPANQGESSGWAYGSSSSSQAVTVAPMVGSKLTAPSRSLDGHFEDLSYDNPQAAAARAAELASRSRGGGIGYISGGSSYGGSGTVYVGPRGGHYTITSGGNRSYQSRR